jgi:hypothetical protein
MKRLKRQIAAAAGVLLALAASVVLLSYSRTVRSIEDGNRALAGHDYAAAEQAYTAAANRVAHGLLPAALFREPYRVLVFNQARLLRATRKYDELARLLERIATRTPELSNDPEYHFWMGIVEYAKAGSETDKQAVRASLQRASDRFRLALESAPSSSPDTNWDAKYNYELTSNLLAGMRNKEKDSQEKINRGGMKILREDPDHPKEQQQKLAPDKQS